MKRAAIVVATAFSLALVGSACTNDFDALFAQPIRDDAGSSKKTDDDDDDTIPVDSGPIVTPPPSDSGTDVDAGPACTPVAQCVTVASEPGFSSHTCSGCNCTCNASTPNNVCGNNDSECDLNCKAGASCTSTCGQGEHDCYVSADSATATYACNDARNCRLTCLNGSKCKIDCQNAFDCDMNCDPSSQCNILLPSGDPGPPSCQTTPVHCSNGSWQCGGACP